MRFMNRIDPDYVVSIHTPLYGLDVTHAKDKAFARRLSDETASCPTSSCAAAAPATARCRSGSTIRHKGACVTIEFGSNPSSGT